jgi:DMSO reductase anchor subunit
MNGQRFDAWPLVVFTTLAIMGAGLLAAPLVAAIVLPARAEAWAIAANLRLLGTALLAAGLVVSLAHLGRPQRAPLALARAGRSRLSNEIVLASVTLAAGMFGSAFPHLSHLSFAASLLASAAAVAFLVSLGLVYALPGQLAWRGAVVASPLILGVGFGVLGLVSSWNPASAGFQAAAGLDARLAIGAAAATFLGADVSLFLVRKRRAMRRTEASSGPAMGASRVLEVRFLLVDVLPACLLLAGLPKGAAGFLGLGILVDRLAFYQFAAQHTTEGEISRVEEVIGQSRD